MDELEKAWQEWRNEMTPENFCYWLNGFFELREHDNVMSPHQLDVIKAKLNAAISEKPKVPFYPPLESRWNTKNMETTP